MTPPTPTSALFPEDSAGGADPSRRAFLRQAAMAGGTALALTHLGGLVANAQAPLAPGAQPSGKCPANPENYNPAALIEAKDYAHLAAGLPGLSASQIQQHVKLYEGYVKKINEIQAALQGATPDLSKVNATYDPFRSLHVEQTYALNGVVLHELYFDNLGGDGKTTPEVFKGLVAREFGSWDNYLTHLKAVGKAMRGWAMTGWNKRDGRIHNYGLDMHNQLVPVHVKPLLVLDVYEHAYMVDYGTNRAAYLDAFLANVRWDVVDGRLIECMKKRQG